VNSRYRYVTLRQFYGEAHAVFSLTIMQPDCKLFNPLPAAACFLEACSLECVIASILLLPEFTPLYNAAKSYIMSTGEEQEQSQGNPVNPPANSVHSTQAAGLRRFTFLAVKMSASQAASTASDVNQDSVQAQLNQ